LGCEGIFPVSPKLAQKMTSKKALHVDLRAIKKAFMSIRAPIFSNQSMLGAIFAQIFREF